MEIYDFTVLEDNILGFDPKDFTFNQKVQLLKAYYEGFNINDIRMMIQDFNGNTRSTNELKELIKILKLNIDNEVKDAILNNRMGVFELQEIKKMIKRQLPKHKILEAVYYGINADGLNQIRKFWERNNATKSRSR